MWQIRIIHCHFIVYYSFSQLIWQISPNSMLSKQLTQPSKQTSILQNSPIPLLNYCKYCFNFRYHLHKKGILSSKLYTRVIYWLDNILIYIQTGLLMLKCVYQNVQPSLFSWTDFFIFTIICWWTMLFFMRNISVHHNFGNTAVCNISHFYTWKVCQFWLCHIYHVCLFIIQ